MAESTTAWSIIYPSLDDAMKIASADLPRMARSVDAALTTLQGSATAATSSAVRQATATSGGRAISSQRCTPWITRALSTRGFAPVVWMGDDKMEGVGSSGLSTRSQAIATDLLRDGLLGLSGDQGDGYLPVLPGSGTAPQIAQVSGTEGTAWSRLTTTGMGMRGILLKTVGTTITYPARRARFVRLHHPTSSSWPGSAEVLVNGVSRGTISSNGGASATEEFVDYDLGSVIDAPVQIRCSTANVAVEGVTFRTELGGITPYDAACSGATAATYDTGSGSAQNIRAIAKIDPALVVIGLGVNDMATVTADAFAASLKSLHDKIVAACPNTGVLIVMSAMRVEDARSATTNDRPSKLLDFEGAVRSVLGGLERVGIIFESVLWQPANRLPANAAKPVEQDPVGWLADSVHPNDFGHACIGNYIGNSLLQAAPSTILDGGTF